MYKLYYEDKNIVTRSDSLLHELLLVKANPLDKALHFLFGFSDFIQVHGYFFGLCPQFLMNFVFVEYGSCNCDGHLLVLIVETHIL